MPKALNGPVRGSSTGRPIMVLFDLLGQRWTLRILWELKRQRLNFRALRACCEEISPTVLNQRLKALRTFDLVDHDDTGYGLTSLGDELGVQLMALNDFAEQWARRRPSADS